MGLDDRDWYRNEKKGLNTRVLDHMDLRNYEIKPIKKRNKVIKLLIQILVIVFTIITIFSLIGKR
ncbi:hypothetical protein Metme_2340 [Methylomonas methanica MC09]|uniref:Uncharacterized protein n=1 Tax=Methylomonas methanica (strain DSM 25384 / MC09) TaxID=857087 RepID=F9ZVD1_METMM|nr:hypothetical protein Metme_2340 [Methylomonas methanica MC09]